MRTYQPSPRGQAPTVTWRHWLLPLGAAVGIVVLLALSPGAPSGIPLSYSRFLNGYSEHTQWLIDREAASLLTRAEARARELLTEHMQALHQLTTALVERETITGDQVRALVRAASPAVTPADRQISASAPSR